MGCADAAKAPGPSGPPLEVAIAALGLPAAGDVVWDIEVDNGAAEVVWQRRVTSTAYGDGAGSASLVGTCDASVGAADNTVRVWIVGVYPAPVAAADAGAFASGQDTGDGAVGATSLPFQNPTATGPLERTVRCEANADNAVRFDVTVARPAVQGFFDVAVSFDDVFCSAKFDCCRDVDGDGCATDGSEDLRLLFDADGARARTFVLALACTAGPGAATATDLYMDAVAIDCDVTTDAATFGPDLLVAPAGDPGNQCTAGAVAACGAVIASPGVDADSYLYQVAVYRGEESLQTGGVSAAKAYWNLAFGVQDGISACQLRTRATADDAADAGDAVVDGVIAAGVVYPYLRWDVDLGSCGAEELVFDDPSAPVTAVYTSPDPNGSALGFGYHAGPSGVSGAFPTLTDLVVSAATLVPDFAADHFTYDVEVSSDTASIQLTPAAAAGYTITVAGQPVASGSPSQVIPLVTGVNPITVAVTSTVTRTYVVRVTRIQTDFIAPDPPVVTSPATSPYLSNDVALALSGTCETDATVSMSGAGSDSALCVAGAFSLTLSVAGDGTHDVQIVQTDQATNASQPTAFAWVRDTTAPADPTLTSPADNPYTSATSDVALAGACETGATVYLDGDDTADVVCAAAAYGFDLHRDVDGTYDYTIFQTDAAGNESGAIPFQWVRDTTIPDAPVVTSPAATPYDSASSSLVLSGTCTDTFEVYVQGAANQHATCAGGAFSFTVSAASDGTYVYQLFQENPLTGLQSANATFTWRRDATPPDEIVVTSPPTNPYFSGDDTIEIGGDCETNATVTMTGSATDSATCVNGSFAFTVTKLTNTTYNFNLVQTDRAGNASLSVLFQWVRDNTIPPTPVVTSPTSPYYAPGTQLTIAGTCVEGYTVTLGGAASDTQTCTGASFSFLVTTASDGTYVYSVHQTNLAGTDSSATSVTWVRDNSAPGAVVITSPGDNPYVSGDTTFALQGTCESAATVTLSGHQSGTDTCTGGTFRFDLSASADGTYDYTLSQTDRAGNVSPTTAFQWTRNTTIPPTPVLSSPSPNPYTSNGSAVTVAGSCNGANLVVVSGAASASATCSGGAFSFTFTETTDGTWVYSVRQEGALTGIPSSSVNATWIRDTTPPAAPTLTSLSPVSPSANANPKAKGTAPADAVAIQAFRTADCSGAVAASGTVANFTGTAGVAVPALLYDTMIVSVRAVDAAGNPSPCAAQSRVYEHRAPQLVADINTTGSGSSSPSQFGVVGSQVFFRASDGIVGYELWVTDGTTAGTRLVKDINAADSSNPANFVAYNGVAYFQADDGENGAELWRSDGTDAGTWMVADINPGAFGSAPAYLTLFNGLIYFTADDGDTGVELWRSDGTAAGTVQVADIDAGEDSSTPQQLTVLGTKLVFRATTVASGLELYASNGSVGNATLIDVRAGALGSSPNYLVVMGGYVYFSANDGVNGVELFRSQGTAATTALVANIYSGSTSSSPAYFAVAGSTLFFRARSNASGSNSGYQLYKYTTTGGVVLVKNGFGGTNLANTTNAPVNIRTLDAARVVFRASTSSNLSEDLEMWVSDGTSAGTFRLVDANPGLLAANPSAAVASNGKAYFTAITSGDQELWETDGTVAGTVRYDLNPGSQGSAPGTLTAFGTGIIVAITTQNDGREPWLVDTSGARLLADLSAQPSSSPAYFAELNGKLLFSADDGVNGRELWLSDGTLAGTAMLKDINTDTGASSSPYGFTAAGGYVYFRADDGVHGLELWRTDGTTAGTALVTDICDGEDPSTPNYFAAVGTTVVFSATDCINGIELWKVTGTGAAVAVADINAGGANGDPRYMATMGTKVYFRATDLTNGVEPWVYDNATGTASLLVNLRNTTSSSSPSAFTVVGGNKLFFVASGYAGTSTGTEIYYSDGTAGNTYLVKDLNPGTVASGPTNLRDLNGKLVWSGLEPTYGRELYTSTGVAGNATLVKDIRAGSGSSNPASLLVHQGLLYFAAIDDAKGNELWVSDGTSAGTTRVLDARAGTPSSNPNNIVSIDASSLMFMANDGVNGNEPWRSNETAAGTYLIQDMNVYGPSWGGAILSIGGTVFFSATDGVNGYELWKY
ncbi:MAG: hypothetical protein EP329_11080 [Deltaproteobacteria bacterium]|nr:MAG: hypothetical protein EP329_11080 [Deltaproteobacteria bacterium]